MSDLMELLRNNWIFRLGVCLFLAGILASGCAKQDGVKVDHTITGASYDFVVMGDNRPDIGQFETFLLAVSDLDVDKVVHVGDMIEFSSPLGFLSFRESLQNCLRDDITFIPVIGNHDMDGSNGNTMASLTLFSFVFKLPTDYLGYKTLEYPDYFFIILNSYYPGEENQVGTAQFAWLRETLDEMMESEPEKPIFVFTHHPVYPAGAHAPIENAGEFNALLMEYPTVKAVFSGHEHLYYHQEVTSGDRTIDYYVSGGAGSELHITERGHAVHHVLGVRVSPNFTVDVLDDQGNIIAF